MKKLLGLITALASCWTAHGDVELTNVTKATSGQFSTSDYVLGTTSGNTKGRLLKVDDVLNKASGKYDAAGAADAVANNGTLVNPTIKDGSGNTVITATGGKANLVNPWATGNYGNLVINTNLYFQVSTVSGSVRAGGLTQWDEANPLGYAYNPSGWHGFMSGSYGSLITPMLSGSGAALSEIQSIGPQLWGNQPYPVDMFSFYSVKNVTQTQPWWCGETNAQAFAAQIEAAKLLNVTNTGSRVALVLDGFWMETNRTASGNIDYRHSLYPNGITNTVAYIRSKGMETWVDGMYLASTPTNGYIQRIVNWGTGEVAGDSNPPHPLPDPGTYGLDWQPAMTANRIHDDIGTLYSWGIEGFICLDQGIQYYGPASSGYRHMMEGQLPYAVCYPTAAAGLGNGESYLWWCQPSLNGLVPFVARHGMSLTMWQPHTLHDPSIFYAGNNLGFDTGSNDTSFPGSAGATGTTGVGWAHGQMSYPIGWITNFPSCYNHFVMQLMEYEGDDLNMSTWATNDWQAAFGMRAVWHATMQYSWPSDYITNGWFQTIFTNSAYRAVLNDPAQKVPRIIRWGTNDSVLAADLSNPTDARAVLFSNVKTNANTSTNLTVTWTQLALNTNLVCNAVDVWSGEDLGNYTNALTVTVTNSATRFFTLTPVRFQAPTGTGSGDVVAASENHFTASNNFAGPTHFGADVSIDGTLTVNSTNSTLTASNIVFTGAINGNGGGLSNIQASAITGTIDTLNVNTVNTTNFNANFGNFTNGFAPGILTVGTLPASPVVGQTCWASDVVTSIGTGGLVVYDGSNWRTRENIIATDNLTNFVLNASAAGALLKSTISTIVVNDALAVGSSGFGFIPRATTAGSGGLVGMNDTYTNGAYLGINCGTSSSGTSYVYGLYENGLGNANDLYACGGIYSVQLAPDGTDNFWCAIGMNSAASGVYPVSGAFFLYDQRNANSVVSNATFSATWTNNWICVTAKASSYTYTDSRLPVTILAGTPMDRLLVLATTNSVLFYTNGVLAAAHTTNIPTAKLYLNYAAITKTAGTTARRLYESVGYVHIRHSPHWTP